MFERITGSAFDKKCNHFFTLYNRCAKRYGFRKALRLTPMRKRALTVVADYSRSDLALFFRELRKAREFFSSADWFDFDWVIKEDNFVKVMEGKYNRCYDFSKSSIKSKADFKEKSF